MAHRTKPKKPEMTLERAIRALREQLQYLYSEEVEFALHVLEDIYSKGEQYEANEQLPQLRLGQDE